MAGNMVDHMPQMPEPPVEVSEDEESNMECPSLSSLEESSEPEMGTSQWEWAFVKDARVEITRPPNSNCFSLVQPGHWKAASKGKDIRLNAAGKKSSSALYHRVTPVRDLGGGAQAAVWEQSAKNPKCRYRPVILRSIPGVMVVTWQWWWDEEKTKVVCLYSYASSGNSFKAIIYRGLERTTVHQALKALHTQLVKENKISIFQKIKNGYGLAPHRRMEWCAPSK